MVDKNLEETGGMGIEAGLSFLKAETHIFFGDESKVKEWGD